VISAFGSSLLSFVVEEIDVLLMVFVFIYIYMIFVSLNTMGAISGA
jgi:hypothetical protein